MGEDTVNSKFSINIRHGNNDDSVVKNLPAMQEMWLKPRGVRKISWRRK